MQILKTWLPKLGCHGNLNVDVVHVTKTLKCSQIIFRKSRRVWWSQLEQFWSYATFSPRGWAPTPHPPRSLVEIGLNVYMAKFDPGWESYPGLTDQAIRLCGHLTCQFFLFVSFFFLKFLQLNLNKPNTVSFSHILTYDDIISWSSSTTVLKWFWKQITILVVFSIIYPEPSGPPRDVLALTISSTSILVKWNPPSELDRNGVITHYTVTYESKSSGTKLRITTSDNSTQKLVSSLRKYSPYYFTVQAVNNIGVGPPSVAVINTTAEDSK